MKKSRIWKLLTLHSLFSKWVVFSIIVVTLLTISVLMFVESVIKTQSKSVLGKTIPFVIESVIEHLGNPPQLEKAMEVTERSGILIRYRGPAGSWTTSDELPVITDLKFKPIKRKIGLRYRIMDKSEKYLLVRDHSHFVLFRIPQGDVTSDLFMDDIKTLLARIAVIFICSIIFFRWLLKPIHRLSKGLERVSRGEIGYELSNERPDELGDMSRQFNRMSRQIRQMMQSRKQLLQDVSHELRSPLARMRLSLAVMPDSQEKNEVESDIAEMNAMLARLLESFRLDSADINLNVVPTDIMELVRGIAQQMKRRRPGIRIVSSLEKPIVRIDLEEFKIVINNLLDNALKYSGSEPTPVEVQVEKNRYTLRIRIRDRGPGIPADDIPHLFEPFYRVDKSRSSKIDGHGLGLSICKKIVDAHQGSISVNSTGGQGTEVLVELPI